MQHRDKQWRRDQRDRVIENLFQHYRNTGWGLGWNEGSSKEPLAVMRQYDAAVRRHNSRVTCSAWCCGNPRLHYGAMTRQEARFAIACSEQFEQVGLHLQRPRKTKW